MNSILLDTRGRLVGRDAEMARINRAFEGGARVVVLAGSFGVGKSRLAAELAGEWDRGIVLGCMLGDVREADQLDAALSRAAGSQAAGDFQRRAFLRWLQRRGPALVVLDAAERAHAAVDELLDEARQHAPDVRWLVTSRVDWGGEHSDRETMRIEPLALDDAVDLLGERLPRGVHAEAEATLASPMARQLVDQLDRLPLAIELAAARCRVLSLDQLSDRLTQKRLSMLRAPSPERSDVGSVRQALMVSYEMLDDLCQQSLCRWAVFRGGFTLEAADGLALGGGEAGEAGTLDILEELLAHSLLYRLPNRLTGAQRAAPRFSMLDSVRDFAREMAGPEQLEQARKLHAAYFAELAADLLPRSGCVRLQASRQLFDEAENFHAVFEYALETGQSEPAYYALRALYHIASHTGGPTERLADLYVRADRAALFEERPDWAAVLLDERGTMTLDANALERAIPIYKHAVELAVDAGLDPVEASSERGLGLCKLLAGELEGAETHLRRSLEAAYRGDYFVKQALAHCGLCNLGWYRQDFDEALEHAEGALEILEKMDDPPVYSLASVHNTLGSTLGMLGLWSRARFHLEQAVEHYVAAHERVREINARFNRAILDLYSGHCDQARAQLAQIIDQSRAVLQDHVTIHAHFNLALIELEEGNLEEVAPHLRACRKLAEPSDFSRGVSWPEMLDCVQAIHLAFRGDVDEAHRTIASRQAARADATEQLASLLELTGVLMEVSARSRGDEPVHVDDIEHAAKYVIAGPPTADEPPGFDWVLRRILTAKLDEVGDGEGDEDRRLLRVGPDARYLDWEGARVDLSRRGPMRRIVAYLVDVHEAHASQTPVDAHQLLEAGWPDQTIEFEAGLNRVYTTLRRLRDLGLRDVVLTVDDGYCIDGSVEVDRVE